MSRNDLIILIADDDEDDIFIARKAIQTTDLDCQIQAVKDGVELMMRLTQKDQFKNTPLPNLILLDLNMPMKDGFQVLREIRSDPRLASIPIAVLSGYTTVELKTQLEELGIKHLVQKDAFFEDCARIMKRLMSE